ncbi:hypothetical protein ACFFF5_08450 [Lederbergia wuyishanensis]|uniref:Uncharacterized protein n=1 Tax=Lederbergia wuyishanensis TaxID=1347903 RepID=A0ABU0D6E6_9BACI|nr:hypothetical protein [Lederbergia wuyishanensis]MDQ0343950.1 hypothetical protein [Lederbergia wuyishanensis]
MEFIILILVIVITISCWSLELKMKEANEQRKEIIELLKELNHKN